jgi:hypothetical protein
MKSVLLASVVFVLTTEVGSAQSNSFVSIVPDAWWLRAEFHPFEAEVQGIPVGKVRAAWCKATEFRKDQFPPDPASDLDQSGGLSSPSTDF